MNGWMNTQWPISDEPDEPTSHALYLRDGHEGVVDGMEIGDCVLLYEYMTKPGRTRHSGQKSQRVQQRSDGRQGIIAIAQVARLREERRDDLDHDDCDDGRKMWWRWVVPLDRVDKEGDAPLEVVLRVLKYNPGGYLLGFGDKHSGVKRLDESVWMELKREFKSRPRRRRS